ncbi:hypothetical protein D1872_328370 [compost metagenome]
MHRNIRLFSVALLLQSLLVLMHQRSFQAILGQIDSDRSVLELACLIVYPQRRHSGSIAFELEKPLVRIRNMLCSL